MKEFLVYDNDNILVTEDGTYFDFYDTKEDKEISIIEEIVYSEISDPLENSKEEEITESIIKPASNKIFIDNSFIFIDEAPVSNKNTKQNYKNKEKLFKFKNPIINYILTFIYFCLKVILIFVFSFMIFCTLRYEKVNYIEEIEEVVTPTPIPISINTEVLESSEKITFKNLMISKAIQLNEIIEGEKECINKLYNNSISLDEASVYFDKTQIKKESILNEFYNQNIQENYYLIQNELKEIYIQSINISKQIKTHYNNSDNKSKAINDFNSFLYKHNERISDYEILLQDF